MNPNDDSASRERDPGEKAREEDSIARSAPRVNERPGGQDAELHPDTAQTMQRDHEDAAGRQRYADARPGDYSRDFQSDESGTHPVKSAGEDEVDEDGVPAIAAKKPHENPVAGED